jgi:hypothetical protein
VRGSSPPSLLCRPPWWGSFLVHDGGGGEGRFWSGWKKKGRWDISTSLSHKDSISPLVSLSLSCVLFDFFFFMDLARIFLNHYSKWWWKVFYYEEMYKMNTWLDGWMYKVWRCIRANEDASFRLVRHWVTSTLVLTSRYRYRFFLGPLFLFFKNGTWTSCGFL